VPNKTKSVIVCHFCGEPGHKAMYCTKASGGEQEVQRIRPHHQEQQQHFEPHQHQPHQFRVRLNNQTLVCLNALRFNFLNSPLNQMNVFSHCCIVLDSRNTMISLSQKCKDGVDNSRKFITFLSKWILINLIFSRASVVKEKTGLDEMVLKF
jgi:hypothetical protein